MHFCITQILENSKSASLTREHEEPCQVLAEPCPVCRPVTPGEAGDGDHGVAAADQQAGGVDEGGGGGGQGAEQGHRDQEHAQGKEDVAEHGVERENDWVAGAIKDLCQKKVTLSVTLFITDIETCISLPCLKYFPCRWTFKNRSN